MKRKLLIWSALLTVVFGAALLQSCSADEDTFATEEYGYYTEEENELVRALADKYGLCVEINEAYYGSKRSIAEIEEEMKTLSSLLGEHKLMLSKEKEGELIYKTVQEDFHIQRTATRAIEGPGSWNGSKKSREEKFTVSVSISWNGSGLNNQSVSGTASISYRDAKTEDYSSGSLSCKIAGDNSIDFSGNVSYSHYTGTDEKGKQTYTTYKFAIEAGQVSTKTPASGTFKVTGGDFD